LQGRGGEGGDGEAEALKAHRGSLGAAPARGVKECECRAQGGGGA
jgi:hypothetical protein